MGMKMTTEFFCPYCQLWITDAVHVQHHHNEGEHGDPDPIRDWRVRIDGVVYESENEVTAPRSPSQVTR